MGLRERKKAKTRAAIQQHALRLFRQQGYDATTVEQIAEAAEVSPSTFFRYFPTKEDVVLWDEFDPLLIAAFKAQPSGLSPLRAFRNAFKAVFAEFSPEELVELRERTTLVLEVPELRSRTLDQFTGTVQLLADVIAEQVGRRTDDFAVRTLAGAVVGAAIAVWLAVADDPGADIADLLDAAMAHLEAGLPL